MFDIGLGIDMNDDGVYKVVLFNCFWNGNIEPTRSKTHQTDEVVQSNGWFTSHMLSFDGIGESSSLHTLVHGFKCTFFSSGTGSGYEWQNHTLMST